MLTYKSLYSLVIEEIKKRLGFKKFKDYTDALNRNKVFSPVSLTPGDVSLDITALISSIIDILTDIVPQYIRDGFNVEATDPLSSSVIVKAGVGVAGGRIYRLKTDVTISIPFDSETSVYYVNIFVDGVTIDKSTHPRKLTVAKIIVPQPGTSRLIQDNKDDWNCYIINLKEYKLYGNAYGKLEEDSIEMLRDNIGEVLADNLIGNIKLSENLKIINSAETVELNSNSLKIFRDGTTVAKFNRDGVFFFDNAGRELARFSTTLARVGNILVGTDYLASGNYISGANGAGFRINSNGNAEFSNVTIRGEIRSSVFKKDEIQISTGDVLITAGSILNKNIDEDDTEITVQEAVFSNNDILWLKNEDQQEFMQVTSGGGTTTLTVTRAFGESGASSYSWKKGTPIARRGNRIGLVASGDESGYLPYIDIIQRTGTNFGDESVKVRLGNLAGIVDADFGGALSGFGLYGNNVYLKGTIIIANGSGYGNLTDIPDELADINATEGTKLIGIEDGATLGADWNTNLTNIPIGLYQIFYQATAPSSGMATGDYWIDSDDNKIYRYNGASWLEVQDDDIAQALADASTAQATADGKVTTFIQATSPTAEGIGDLWIDTDDNQLYRWSGSEWISIQDTGIAQALADASTAQATADGKIVSFYADEPPTAEGIGDLWFDTNNDNKAYRWSGDSWVNVQDAGIVQALLDASNAQSTADSKIKVFKQDSPPTAEEVGDLWIDTNDGNKLYRWSTESGGDWEEVRDAGAVRALLALDTSGNVVTKVLPGSNIGTPLGAGLFLGADYLGYYSGSEWKVFIKNDGTFTFKGDNTHYVSWNGVTFTVRGQLNADDILAGTLDVGRLGAGTITADKYAQLRNTYVYTGEDSLDASYPFEIPFEIVSETIDIHSIKVSFKIKKFRAYSTGVPSGGGSTTVSGGGSTTPSGGGDTSGATGTIPHAHTHTVLQGTGGTDVLYSGGNFYANTGGDRTIVLGEHTITVYNGSSGTQVELHLGKLWANGVTATITTSTDNGHSHTVPINNDGGAYGSYDLQIKYEGSQYVFVVTSVYGTGSVSFETNRYEPTHTHTTPNHAHDTPNHQHDTPAHAHALTFGIYEEDNSPITINIYVDKGSGYGSSIGTYTTDQQEIDITNYIKVSGWASGWKKIKFTVDKRARIFGIITCKVDITA